MTAPSMAEVLARWNYETYDSHYSMPGGLSWEEYKRADPGGAESYLTLARIQSEAIGRYSASHTAALVTENELLHNALLTLGFCPDDAESMPCTTCGAGL